MGSQMIANGVAVSDHLAVELIVLSSKIGVIAFELGNPIGQVFDQGGFCGMDTAEQLKLINQRLELFDHGLLIDTHQRVDATVTIVAGTDEGTDGQTLAGLILGGDVGGQGFAALHAIIGGIAAQVVLDTLNLLAIGLALVVDVFLTNDFVHDMYLLNFLNRIWFN